MITPATITFMHVRINKSSELVNIQSHLVVVARTLALQVGLYHPRGRLDGEVNVHESVRGVESTVDDVCSQVLHRSHLNWRRQQRW